MALCRYALVATTEQDVTLQEHALRTAGGEVSRAWFPRSAASRAI